jgi:hypothetical protein
MARERDDDLDDRPRRRDDRDDDDDRPRRRDDRDDYDDDRPRRRRGGEMGPLDKMFRDTNIVFLVLFGICCGIIALVLSAVGYFTAKDEKAKSNAMLVLIISGIMSVVGIILRVTGVVAGFAAGR